MQVLVLLQEVGDKSAAAVGAAWHSLISPFAVFGESWLLNVLFFGTLGLLAYSLLVLAPKQ